MPSGDNAKLKHIHTSEVCSLTGNGNNIPSLNVGEKVVKQTPDYLMGEKSKSKSNQA